MARLNEDEEPQEIQKTRLSLLPGTPDGIEYSQEWLENNTQTPTGLQEAHKQILVVIRERDQLALQCCKLQTENQAFEAQVMLLIQERDEQQQELLQAYRARDSTPQPQSSSSSKSTKLPDPPIFLGTTEPALEDWLSKMKTKLIANHDHYPTEALQMGYVENRVSGQASKHLAPRLRSDAINKFTTADEMFETLDRVYGDPDRAQTAQNDFRKLYQGTKDFNSFWADFQRLSSELDYSPKTLISELRNKVSAELERAIITEIDPVDVYALARKCQLYDQNIQKVKAREARFQAPKSARVMPSQAQPSIPITIPARNPSLVPVYNNRQAVPRLSEEDRQKLHKAGQCFYCKATGHIAINCPAKSRPSTSIQEMSAEPEAHRNTQPAQGKD